MTSVTDSRGLSRLTRLLLAGASLVAVLAGMRAASTIIAPVMLALLITIAWTPGSLWLQRRGWNPTIAALTGIVLGVSVLAVVGGLVWVSLIQLQDKLPTYQVRLEALQVELRTMLRDLPVDSSRLFSSDQVKPSALVGYALTAIKKVGATAGKLVVLMVLMAFMMIEGVRYPQKLHNAFSAFPDAHERFSRFGSVLRSYVTVNSIFGLIAAVINTALLLALGVDFAILWGVLSFLLSFVPNIGFVVALVPPALLALVEFGFARAGGVVGGYVAINFLVDNVVKPRFMAESVDLAPIVVVLSLLFWGWLLGPMGALVAVPLSIAAKFLFESFEDSRWLAQLMSDQK
jgi:AI-2 transport protein TqsA